MQNEKHNSGSEELIQLVSFHLGKEEYGVNILNVQEINKIVHITTIPNAPSFVEGIINLRGKVIPVINLRKRMGLPEKAADKDTRIVVVDMEGRITGFIVDSVSEVLRIPASITEAPPEFAGGKKQEYIISVAKLEDRLLMLLDLSKVLAEDEKAQLAEM